MTNLLDRVHGMNRRSVEQFASKEFKNASGDAVMNNGAPKSYKFKVTLINPTVAGTVYLFGDTLDSTTALNVANNTLVTVEGTTHEAIKRKTASAPIRIKGFQLRGTTVSQMTNTFYVGKSDTYGGSSTTPVDLGFYQTAADQNTLLINASDLQFAIGPDDYFKMAINANETLTTFSFMISEEVNQTNALNGQGNVTVNTNSLGFPQNVTPMVVVNQPSKGFISRKGY